MDLARIRELIDLMNRHRLEELEVEEGGSRVRLRKQGIQPVVEHWNAAPQVPGGEAQAAAAVPASAASPDDPTIVRSPMVGTFYRSPNPDAEPFFEVEDTVEEGAVLCIIEAMKVMNEIKAERGGILEEVLAENGEPVEYGTPLFRIV